MVRDNNWKSYNGQPLKDGEVLVPQMTDRNYARSIGANLKNLRTWKKAGIAFTVMFVPVPAEQEKIGWRAFNADVNELLDEKLGPNRFSRCLVPQDDGSVKPCPKVSGGNHEPCATCPYRGKYEREDKSIVSIDQMEEHEYHLMLAAPSAESEMLEEAILDDLLEYLRSINPMLADVVALGHKGFERKDIIGMLPVKASRGYELYKKAKALTEKFIAQ